MANETSIEAARNRIQRLVEEIATLSKADIASEEFFQQFLERAVAAADAKGGAVWLVGARSQDGKNEFQLAAHVAFDSSLFQTDEAQRAALLKIMTDVIQQKRPAVLAAEQPATPQNPAPAPTANRTAYGFLHVPLFLQQQPLGILQVWLQPYVTQANYAEFVTFLSSLTGYVEQHLQSRRLGNLVLESQRLQHLLRFAGDIAGSLDPNEVARYAANYGRDLVACERAAVLWREGGRWKVLAISGQEVVEKKSAMVKAMAAFVGAHSGEETQVLSKKELLERASAVKTNDEENQAQLVVRNTTDHIDIAYFQLSHVVSAVICPLHNQNKQLTGAFFCESTSEAYFENPPGKAESPAPRRVAEWIAIHTGKALSAASDYHSLPLLKVTRSIRATRLAFTADRRKRTLTRLVVTGAIALIVLLWPVKNQVEGDCLLNPVHRAAVVSEVPGRIDRILTREGERVTKGQPLAELDKRRLQSDLQVVLQEKLRYLAEGDRARAAGDEAAAQVALLQASALTASEEKLRADLESATLRAPIDGIVMTKDLDLRVGEVLQPGSLFAEISGFDQWEMQLEISEKDIGRVERKFEEQSALPANFILYAQSAHIISATLTDQQQISATAFPRDRENVFLVTYRDLQLPAAIQANLRPGLSGRGKIEMGREPAVVWAGKRIYRWFQFGWIARFFDWLFY